MYLCCVAGLSWFRVQFFELWPLFKKSKFWKKSLYYSPWIFPKNGSEIIPNFYYIFLYILMYLCCVESLSWFRLQFFELWTLFKNSKFWKKSLYYSPWIFPKNGSKITKKFYYIFLNILMYLCCVASLSWFRLQFFELWPLFKNSKFWKNPCTIAHGFFQKMAPKSPKNFITFSYTHWCTYAVWKVWADSDFNFSSYDHFLKTPNFGKNPCTIAHGFFQKMAPKSQKNFITFSHTHMLCSKFELIPTSIFRVMTTF